MNKALLTNGRCVTIDEFKREGLDKTSERHNLRCPRCKEPVSPANLLNPKRRASFRHDPRSDRKYIVEKCPWSSTSSKRTKSLYSDRQHIQKGLVIKKRFFEDDFLPKAFHFIWSACGKGNFRFTDFEQCINEISTLNAWAYEGMEHWLIPYVMLVAGDFTGTSKVTGERYKFHFAFSEGYSVSIDEFLVKPHKYQLERYFSGGKKCKKEGTIFETPCLISSTEFFKRSRKSEWVKFDWRHLRDTHLA